AAFVEGFNAARLDRVSVRSLERQDLAAERAGGTGLFRLRDGYDRVVEVLARGLQGALALGVSARRVRWRRGRVEIEARDAGGARHLVRAAAALITLPLGVLKAGDLRFEPALPAWKRAAIGALEMGGVIKVALRFRQPPWRERGLRGLGFLHAPGQPFPTFWAPRPFRAPALMAWVAGPAAERLRAVSAARLPELALRSLASALGAPPSSLRALLASALAFDWQRDPFSRGAYSWVPVGAVPQQLELARPVDATLF